MRRRCVDILLAFDLELSLTHLHPQESQLSSQEKIIRDLREELSSLKESESSALSESKVMTGEVADLRLQLERLRYDSKEAAITSDSLKEQNAELERELEDLRVRLIIVVRYDTEAAASRRGRLRMPRRRRGRRSRRARIRRRLRGWRR